MENVIKYLEFRIESCKKEAEIYMNRGSYDDAIVFAKKADEFNNTKLDIECGYGEFSNEQSNCNITHC